MGEWLGVEEVDGLEEREEDGGGDCEDEREPGRCCCLEAEKRSKRDKECSLEAMSSTCGGGAAMKGRFLARVDLGEGGAPPRERFLGKSAIELLEISQSYRIDQTIWQYYVIQSPC